MGAIETLKEVGKVLREADKIDAYQKILDLQGQVQDLMQENYEQKRRIAELEEKWSIQEELEFRDNAYWKKSGDGPFCIPCWDKNKALMRMTERLGGYECHDCKYRTSPKKARSYRS